MTTNTDDRSNWLRTGPLTAEQRRVIIDSVDDTLDESEAAVLLRCTIEELRAEIARR